MINLHSAVFSFEGGRVLQTVVTCYPQIFMRLCMCVYMLTTNDRLALPHHFFSAIESFFRRDHRYRCSRREACIRAVFLNSRLLQYVHVRNKVGVVDYDIRQIVLLMLM